MCHLTCSSKIASGTDADLAIGSSRGAARVAVGRKVGRQCLATRKKKRGGTSLLAVVLSSLPHSSLLYAAESLLFAAESQLLSR